MFSKVKILEVKSIINSAEKIMFFIIIKLYYISAKICFIFCSREGEGDILGVRTNMSKIKILEN